MSEGMLHVACSGHDIDMDTLRAALGPTYLGQRPRDWDKAIPAAVAELPCELLRVLAMRHRPDGTALAFREIGVELQCSLEMARKVYMRALRGVRCIARENDKRAGRDALYEDDGFDGPLDEFGLPEHSVEAAELTPTERAFLPALRNEMAAQAATAMRVGVGYAYKRYATEKAAIAMVLLARKKKESTGGPLRARS